MGLGVCRVPSLLLAVVLCLPLARVRSLRRLALGGLVRALGVAAGWFAFGPPGFLRSAVGLAVLSLVAVTALRGFQVEGFIDQHLSQMPVAETGSPSVVFVNPAAGYYAADLVQNDPFLRNQPLVLVTNGRNIDAQMMHRQFPELKKLSDRYNGSVWGYATED